MVVLMMFAADLPHQSRDKLPIACEFRDTHRADCRAAIIGKVRKLFTVFPMRDSYLEDFYSFLLRSRVFSTVMLMLKKSALARIGW